VWGWKQGGGLDEVRQSQEKEIMQTTTRMNQNLAEVHEAISRELHYLYTKWNYYKRLFGTDDETVGLLSRTADFFFLIYDQLLRDDIIITVCRLTDPASSMARGQRRDNLTIAQLVALIPASEQSLLRSLEAEIADLTTHSATLREHRNRRIGHYDLETRVRRANSRLPGIGFNDVDAVLENLSNILNAIERHYDQNAQNYSVGIYGSGNVEDLIEFMQRSEELERYFNRTEFGDTDDKFES
jgi:hypothetical protein